MPKPLVSAPEVSLGKDSIIGSDTRGRAINRRSFLRLAGAGIATVAIPRWGDARQRTLSRWSSASTWAGKPPGPGDVVRISRPILVDRSVHVAAMVIQPGGMLVFDPNKSITLRSRRNIIVRGTLVMKPANPRVIHRIKFRGVNENRFKGGGTKPLTTDVGLWVMGRGRLRLRGSPKTAWTRAARGVKKGTRRVKLRRPPKGWSVGDELVITPTGAPTSPNFDSGFERMRIRRIQDRKVFLSRRTQLSHPKVLGRGPEVVNLTRNVRLEGTRRGRAHIFIRTRVRQVLKHVAIRHMGPQQQTDDGLTENVAGRHPLHFHMSGSGTRGSKVIGVVVRNSGGHAFVPHLSNGITFKDCIAYDVFFPAYWWPHPKEDDGTRIREPSHNITWERCAAFLVRQPSTQHRMASFLLGQGQGNACRNCVAVGNLGSGDSAGFIWPAGASEAVWDFRGNVAHNNRNLGSFVWQNSRAFHVVEDSALYRNGRGGLGHGAYRNGYLYRNLEIAEQQHGLEVHAVSQGPEDGTPLVFKDLRIRAETGVTMEKHRLRGRPITFTALKMEVTGQPVIFREGSSGERSESEWRDCRVNGRPMVPEDFDMTLAHSGSRVRVYENGGLQFELVK